MAIKYVNYVNQNRNYVNISGKGEINFVEIKFL